MSGNLYVADGTYFYVVRADGVAGRQSACCSHPAIPGSCADWPRPAPASSWSRRLAASCARYRPGANETDYLATDFDQLYGVATGPGDTVRIRRTRHRSRACPSIRAAWKPCAWILCDPVGRGVRPRWQSVGRGVRCGTSGAGCSGSSGETVADGLRRPQGILVVDGQLYVVDAGAKEVIAFDLNGGERRRGMRSSWPAAFP